MLHESRYNEAASSSLRFATQYPITCSGFAGTGTQPQLTAQHQAVTGLLKGQIGEEREKRKPTESEITSKRRIRLMESTR